MKLEEQIKQVMEKNDKGVNRCPSCQKFPTVGLGKRGSCQLHGDPFQSVTITCANRDCKAPLRVSAGDIFNGGEPKAKAEAIKKWNTYAQTSAHDIIRQLVDIVTQQHEALDWSRAFIKFHVAPERCVEIGDDVKSAIKLYEEQVEALALSAPIVSM